MATNHNGHNGYCTGIRLALELENERTAKGDALLVQKLDGRDYFEALDPDGNGVGFPARALMACEQRHIRSEIWRLWKIRVLKVIVAAGVLAMIYMSNFA